MKRSLVNNMSGYELGVNTEATEKISIGEVWENQPPVMHWCLGLTTLSFGCIYMFLFTML